MLNSGNSRPANRPRAAADMYPHTLPESEAPPRYGKSLLLPAAAVFVPSFILAVVGWLNWNNVWNDAKTDMERSAMSVAEYGKRTLQSYSVAAGRVNDRLRGMSDADIHEDERSLHDDLFAMLGELSQSDLVYVIDRDGHPLLASNLYPVPKESSLADRDYFQELLRPDRPDVVISKTFVGRFDGRLLFSVARPRMNTGNPAPADGFDGVVAVSVSPLVLADGLRALLSAPTDRLALVRSDGWGISTTSGLVDAGQPLTRIAPESPFHTFATRGAAKGTYTSDTAMSGASALVAMQKIEGFPIYAVSVRPGTEIAARWWGIMSTQLLVGIPAIIGLLLLSLQVMRDQRQLAASNVALKRYNDLSISRLARAQRFGLVGTFEFDMRSGVSRRSPEYMAIHGLPAVATIESHDDWANRLHPDDRQRASNELSTVLSDTSGATEYAQTYRIITSAGEVRWIAARGEVMRDAGGHAYMLLGAHVDVTPLRKTELALAESDARLRLAQEAVGIGAWEWVQALQSLICSPKMLDIWGLPADTATVSLRTVLARVHPDDRTLMRDMMRQLRGTQTINRDFRIERPTAKGDLETVWLAMRAHVVTPLESLDPRAMGVVYDITQRKRSEELTTLMAHEVEHRAKNALAVVSSLLRMTKADSADQLARVMEGRVNALSATMGLLGKGRWQDAGLRDIIESELKPFTKSDAGDGHEMTLSGPPIRVSVETAQPLAMALHELATNAVKYGALSVPTGSLDIAWRTEGDRIYLSWQESGGPPLCGVPPKSGFGSRLIAMLFEGQIQGEIERRWEPPGFLCLMSWPTRHV